MDVAKLRRWHPDDYRAGTLGATYHSATAEVARGFAADAWDRGDFEGAAYWSGVAATLEAKR